LGIYHQNRWNLATDWVRLAVTASVSTLPAQPISGRECKLRFSATAGNFVRLWCTDAPPGSKLRNEIDATGATQISVASGDVGRDVPFLADKGGAYVFRVEEISKGANALGGVYDTDPNKAPSEALLGFQSETLYFASALTCNLGVGQDTAELLLYVLNAQVIATSFDLHGVVSPVLGKTKSGIAKMAAESAAVRAAVASLVGVAVTVLGDTGVWLDSLIDSFNAHRVATSVHAANDSDNAVAAAFRHASTTEAQKKSVAALRKALDNHMRNDNPAATTPGTGSAAYHSGIGGEVDWANALLPAAPSDQLSVLLSAADAYRAFEAHRLSDVHAAHDTVSVAASPSPLLALHVAFLRQLATQSPANPANEHSAKSLLMSGGGFKEN
jgi:hypothetical protein